jgi:peroxiredoxin
MSVTPSNKIPLKTKAPDFSLKDTNRNTVNIDDFNNSKGLIVAFICNHCPFVIHIIKPFTKIAKDIQDKGIAVVGINSNDIESYPDDSPANMKKTAEELGFTFPYLFDETQKVAKEYKAACTPDFFLFDDKMELVYHGQLDDSRPSNSIPVTGSDLMNAVDKLVSGEPILKEQKMSIGCNIKWKAGNEPDNF